jgi:hypothetical protein
MNLIVEMISSRNYSEELMVAIIRVREEPPRESLSSRVSLLYR